MYLKLQDSSSEELELETPGTNQGDGIGRYDKSKQFKL